MRRVRGVVRSRGWNDTCVITQDFGSSQTEVKEKERISSGPFYRYR